MFDDPSYIRHWEENFLVKRSVFGQTERVRTKLIHVLCRVCERKNKWGKTVGQSWDERMKEKTFVEAISPRGHLKYDLLQ
jgi:hypothetical protein